MNCRGYINVPGKLTDESVKLEIYIGRFNRDGEDSVKLGLLSVPVVEYGRGRG